MNVRMRVVSRENDLRPKLAPHCDWIELPMGELVMVALAAIACW